MFYIKTEIQTKKYALTFKSLNIHQRNQMTISLRAYFQLEIYYHV